MKAHWFNRKGLFFLPNGFVGWMIFIIALLYAIYEFIQIDKGSHSVSETLMSFLFNVIIIAVVYSAIGYFTSRKPQE